MYSERINSHIKDIVRGAFKDNAVNDSNLENAVADALANVLTDRTFLRELTESITKAQDFNKRRMDSF